MNDRSEAEFLAGYDPGAYQRPSVAVDIVVLTIRGDDLLVLLVRRAAAPERGKWALPGGFLDIARSLDDCARDVLARKARLRDIFLEQLYTFGAPDRDPRTRILSVAYYALVHVDRLTPIDDGIGECLARVRVPWKGETGGPVDLLDTDGHKREIAFDHRDIVGMAVKRLRGKLSYAPIGYELLPRRFSLLALQRVHEIIQDTSVNKDSFRRRMLASGELEATSVAQTGVDHRPATLYRVRARKKA